MSASKWKQYPEYKSTDIEWNSRIPKKWKIVPLRYLCKIKTGEKDLIDQNPEGKYPFFVRSPKVERISTYSYDGEGILTAGDGNIGDIFHYVNGKFDYHQRVYLFHDFSDISARFLYYFLKANLKKVVLAMSAKSTVDSIRLPMLSSFPVSMPSINEQRLITNFIQINEEKITALIQNLSRTLELLQEKRSVLITRAVTKGLNPNAPMKDSGTDWIGEIPSHWSLSKVGYLSKIISKGTTPSTIGKEIVRQGIKFLKAENIHYDGSVSANPEFFIDEETDTILKRSRLISDDILIVIAGATTGKCAVLTQEFVPANTNQAVCFVRLHDTRISKFIQTWLSCELIQKQIKQDSVQSAQPNLAMEDVRNFVCPLPPIDEIELITNKIIEFTNNISNSKSEIEKQIKYFEEYRTSLISAAVTGKIDVRQLGN